METGINQPLSWRDITCPRFNSHRLTAWILNYMGICVCVSVCVCLCVCLSVCVAVCVCRKERKRLKTKVFKVLRQNSRSDNTKNSQPVCKILLFFQQMLVDWHTDRCLISINDYKLILKEPSWGVLRKECSKNLQ